MKKEFDLKGFDNCKNIIKKLVGERYQRMRISRPDVDFEDLLSEGYAIYAWCLQNFNDSKNMKFTSYLYMNLKGRLADYYKCTVKPINLYEDYRYTQKEVVDDTFEENIVSKPYDLSSEVSSIYSEAEENLSYEANLVLKYILSRDWESATRRTAPSLAQIRKRFGFTQEVVDSVMGEIKSYWKKVA